MVLWGWGEPGAFDHVTPGHAHLRSRRRGRPHARVRQGSGRHRLGRVADPVLPEDQRLQGAHHNPVNQFGGVWYDDSNDIAANHNDADGLTGLELAQEAQRAAAHFGVTDLKNSQFVIAQPQKYSEKGFETRRRLLRVARLHAEPVLPRRAGGLAFTNMPYVLNQTTSCGQNAVNTGYYAGRLDGFTIVVGHEIEETVTDPGAEDVINGVNLGGWYDQSGWENADKCAWVGYT